MKKALSIGEMVTPEDSLETMKVIREAKNATYRHWDGTAHKMVEAPDHKTRLAAATLELAYAEGLPVQRMVQGHVEMESAEEVLERLRSSPEAMKALHALAGDAIDVE